MSILMPLIWIRNAFSRLLNIGKKETRWEPYLPIASNTPAALRVIQGFTTRYYVWTSDPWDGRIDNVYTVRHMNWQMMKYDNIHGDCDDQATYSCYLVRRMIPNSITYRVNIYEARHVICIFRVGREFYYIDNDQVCMDSFSSIYECISHVYSDPMIYDIEILRR